MNLTQENINKIKFKKVGKHYYTIYAWGRKIIKCYACPICKEDIVVYKRKGLFKQVCSYCNFINIGKKFQIVGENDILSSFKKFIVMVEL